MKTTIVCIAILLTGFSLISCDPEDILGNGEDQNPVLIRYLGFKYVEIPASMSDATAIALMRDERSNALRNAAVERWFPTTDSLTNPFTGAKSAINRIIITPPGTGHNGGSRLLGGQNVELHPFQPGIPSSLLLDATNGGHAVGQTHTDGMFEVRFNENELVVGGSTAQGDFMEFILDSHNMNTTYAAGRFMFIARNLDNPQDQRRWAIFDGQFGLQHGN